MFTLEQRPSVIPFFMVFDGLSILVWVFAGSPHDDSTEFSVEFMLEKFTL